MPTPIDEPAAAPAATRIELIPAAPLDLRPDPWQRLLAVGSILSVLVVAIGLYVTNEANRRQLDVALQGQLTDRFTRAVEQLGQAGAAKIDVRLGAVYALERIMRDSAQDQPAVVEVLAAYVRVHAPLPAGVGPLGCPRPPAPPPRRPARTSRPR
ncbi:hypothetical protein [Pilimelia anulata]|nr:hypothetical protein [Pilimelia anulata]